MLNLAASGAAKFSIRLQLEFWALPLTHLLDLHNLRLVLNARVQADIGIQLNVIAWNSVFWKPCIKWFAKRMEALSPLLDPVHKAYWHFGSGRGRSALSVFFTKCNGPEDALWQRARVVFFYGIFIKRYSDYAFVSLILMIERYLTKRYFKLVYKIVSFDS